MKREDSKLRPSRQVFDEMGLTGFEEYPNPPSGHVHDAVEISAFEYGSVTMLYGGTPVRIEPNRLIVHWGMLPHQVLECPPGALVVGLHLPLAWLLQWDLPASLLGRLLGLDLFVEPSRQHPCPDLNVLRDWVGLLARSDEVSRKIVLTEVRARLLRLSQTEDNTMGEARSEVHATRVFHAALKYIVRHFREPIILSGIAGAGGVSQRHLTRLFHQNTGQTINTYITGLRLSHAMRLLVTTDRTVTDIMYDAGFSCTTHFYKAFRAQTGCTPRQYRRKEH